jgi:nitronate monooxygenase
MRTKVSELLGIEYPIIRGGMQWVGMVIGLIDDVPTCDQLIQRVVRDCRERLRSAIELAA